MTIDGLAQEVAAGRPVRSLRMADDHWPELDGQGASFEDCLFERLQFSSPVLADARFVNCRFVACRFSQAELAGAHFERCGFAAEDAKGCSFAISDLRRAVFRGCDLSLAGLARAIADIAARARSGDLKPDELSGGTFTITNIGSQGALFDTPILVPPQAAMLGTGAIVKRPRVIVDELGNESIGVRSVCYLPLTYDHRLIDGADAGRFLTTIKRRLEEGAFEADLGL